MATKRIPHPIVSFATTRAEHTTIREIVARAARNWHRLDRQALAMDVTACHCNGMPLDLQRLLAASDFDFVHDLVGIARHIDRTTGKLGGCIFPRCARPQAAAS